ncbi:MAG: GntR family transcriptional regulator, partial [Pseudomonadota bacterium]
PLREALIALEAQGLIHRQPRKGAVVFKPTLRQFLAIMEVQARLEGQAAGLAARRLSVERGRRLEAVRDACDAHMATFGDGDPDRYYQRNLDFHGTVAEAAGNDVLFSMVKSNALKLMAYYRARYRFTGVTAASVADHRAIAGAILDRDSPGAEEKMQRHVQFDDVTAMDLLTIFE